MKRVTRFEKALCYKSGLLIENYTVADGAINYTTTGSGKTIEDNLGN
jgi:hypothetical protein